MTIDKQKLKALAERAVEDFPLFDHSMAYAAPAVLALLAEIESTETRLHDVAVLCATVEQERDQLKAENEALRKALLEASEEVAAWGAYASEYFQEKHDLAGCVAKLHAAAMAKEVSHG